MGANLRRIEALTSFDAYDYLRREEQQLVEAAAALKAPVFDVAERAAANVRKVKELETAVRAKDRPAVADMTAILDQALDVGYRLVVHDAGQADASGLRALSDTLRTSMGGGAVVLASVDPGSGRPLLLAAGADDAIAAGFDAGALIRQVAPEIGGGGGGKAAMAQAGGSNAGGIARALDAAREVLGAK